MKKKLLIATALCTTLAVATCVFGERREAKQTALFEKEAAQIQSETMSSSSSTESSVSTESSTSTEPSTSETSSSKEEETMEVAEYTVQRGDTYSRILAIAKCSQDELEEMNHWQKLPALVAGKQIKVPKDAVKKLNQSKETKEDKSSTTEESVAMTSTYVDTTVMPQTEETISSQPVPQQTQQPVQQTPVQSAPVQPVQQTPAPVQQQVPVQQAPTQPVQQAPVAPAPIQ